MARKVDFATELEEISKSGLKFMQLSKREGGNTWVVLTRYECGCEGQIDLNTLLDDKQESSNRLFMEALRLAYACGRHGAPGKKSEGRAEAHA